MDSSPVSGVERWRLVETGHTSVVPDGNAAALAVHQRLAEGLCETWFESDQGRKLGVTTNGLRAMVVVLDGPGGDGRHAVDRGADRDRVESGYLLANGQEDAYRDHDTLPLTDALRAAGEVIDGEAGSVDWEPDR